MVIVHAVGVEAIADLGPCVSRSCCIPRNSLEEASSNLDLTASCFCSNISCVSEYPSVSKLY